MGLETDGEVEDGGAEEPKRERRGMLYLGQNVQVMKRRKLQRL